MSCHYHSEATCLHRNRFESEDHDFDEDEFRGQVETTLGDDPWTYLSCTDEECEDHEYEDWCYNAHIDAIVIAVDGACTRNGQVGARSAIGVFFHRDSGRNRALRYESNTGPHTNQRAELRAGLYALDMAAEIRRSNPTGRRRMQVASGPTRKLRRVVIKTDSKYLVDGMTDWMIYKWSWNGEAYINGRGMQVSNSDLFRSLQKTCEALEVLGVEVQFWHVYRERNKEADHLAKAALRGPNAEEAMAEYTE